MPRPKVEDPRTPRPVRFSEGELAEIKSAAEKQGVGWTTFLRETVLAYARELNKQKT